MLDAQGSRHIIILHRFSISITTVVSNNRSLFIRVPREKEWDMSPYIRSEQAPRETLILIAIASQS